MFDKDQKKLYEAYKIMLEAPVTAPDETETQEPQIDTPPERAPRRSPFRPPKPEIEPEPQNTYLKEDYEDEAEPSTVRWFSSKPLEGHPILSKHGHALAKKSFDHTKQRLQNLNSNYRESFRIFNEILRIESRHKDELNQMAKDIVSQIYGIDQSQLMVGDDVEINKTESNQEWSERGAVVDDRVRKHIHMRATMNMLSHGAAVHQMLTLHHMVKEALDEIDPNLTQLYDKFAAGATHMYWFQNIENAAEQLKGSAVGSTKVEYKEENGEEVPVVKAAAICFPVLVQELSKGVMQMLSHHHLGRLDKSTLQRVLAEADKIQLEPYFIMVGPALWRMTLDVSKNLNLNLSEIISSIASHEPDEVHNLFDKMDSNPKAAENIIKTWHSEMFEE
jgi:hypothetical protein